MGERSVRNAEVTGSIPVGSIIGKGFRFDRKPFSFLEVSLILELPQAINAPSPTKARGVAQLSNFVTTFPPTSVRRKSRPCER